jgi:DNA polymerase-3 subunit gamma/tau
MQQEIEIPQENSSESYIGLARKYRPSTFSDLVGQDQISRALEQQLLSRDKKEGKTKVSQAYIFSGPRGTGKTSAARILAKCLNCSSDPYPTPHPCGKCEQCVSITRGTSMDVIEIDGASNNRVDDIRNLQETISQNPFSARKKIYIIDEVHMLSTSAFNALLKTLEEPPPFVIFIFATTEYEKIPETIKSRCQSFQFRRISMDDLIKRLNYVAEQEHIEMDPDERRAILDAIAFSVDGGLRDALMAMDQIAALSEGIVRLDETVRFLGVVEHELLIQTVENLHKRDTRGLLDMVHSLVERGRDLERFVKNLLLFLRDLMILKSGADPDLVHLSDEKLARAKAILWAENETGQLREVVSYPELLNWMQVFMQLEAQIKEAVQVRIHLEFAFVKLTAIEPMAKIETLIETLSSGKGAMPRRTAPAATPASSPAPTQSAPVISAQPAAAPRPDTPDLFGNSRRSVTPVADSPLGEPIEEPGSLWKALVEQADSMGMELSIAIRECAFLGLEGSVLRLGLSAKSFSRRTLEHPDNQQAIKKKLRNLSGKSLGIRIESADPGTAKTSNSPRSGGTTGGFRPSRPEGEMTVQRAAADPAPAFERIRPEEKPAQSSEDRTNAGSSVYQAFLSQNPTIQIRKLLGENPALREKVETVRRFFEGRLIDPAGNEVII